MSTGIDVIGVIKKSTGLSDVEKEDSIREIRALQQSLLADKERLEGEKEYFRDQLSYVRKTTDKCIERYQAAEQSNTTLQEQVREAIEIYTCMEGFISESAPEAYLQRILRQMYEALNQENTNTEQEGR